MAFFERLQAVFPFRFITKNLPTSIPLHTKRADVESVLGTHILDLTLYERALRHRSILRSLDSEASHSNETLEFLGDAVLGLVVAQYLFENYPEEDEGFLTRTRSKLVNGQILADYAKEIGLSELILMSENMEQGGGRRNKTILADAFEAIIGALYLDRGYDISKKFILSTIETCVDLEILVEQKSNYKSILLEFVQAKGWAQPEYVVVTESGPSHKKEFTVEVLVLEKPMGVGVAGSKKKAEQKAAEKAMEALLSD